MIQKIIIKKLIVVSLLLSLYCFGTNKFVSEGLQGLAWGGTGNNMKEEVPQKKKNIVDDTHEVITEKILTTASWLDSFFDDERSISEENKSKVWLRLNLFAEEGQDVDVNAKFRVKIVLPKAEERVQLIIAGDGDDEEDSYDPPQERMSSDFANTNEKNSSTSLWYFFKSTAKKNVSIRVGVRFSGLEPVFYAGPRYRQTFELDTWDIRFIQSLRWFTTDGWESKTDLDFERQLYEKYLFRTTVGGNWYENRNGFFYYINFLLYQPLKFTKALQYEWRNDFETRPTNQLTESAVSLRYRQNIWRDWLFFEVEPRVRFPVSRDYNATPGIKIELEMVFGGGISPSDEVTNLQQK